MMSTAEGRAAAHAAVDRYYVGYLSEALPVLDRAESELEATGASHPDVIRAEVIAHKIKGNAALYDLPELGALAKRLETTLKTRAPQSEIAPTLKAFAATIQYIIDHGTYPNDVEALTETPRAPVEYHEPVVIELTKPIIIAPTEDQSTFAGTVHTEPFAIEEAQAGERFENKSVLAVFANPWFEDFLGTYFGSGVDIQFRRSCAEAIQYLAGCAPDLIICESDLPDTPGISFMKFMRANGAASKVPFLIAFPDGSDFAEISEAIAAGASAIVDNKSNAMQIAELAEELLAAEASSVLIIDDDEPVRELLRNTFERAEFKVETAVDGMDALSRLGTRLPDLIILDRLMPRMNGEATLRELQASMNTGAVPVIVLTAMDNAGEASKWLMRGASEFIAKPFDPEEVLERARRLLKSNRRHF